MGYKAEAAEIIDILKNTYQEILELSKRQLNWVEKNAEKEGFQEAFQEMTSQWIEKQSKILKNEQRLRELMANEELIELYTDQIGPLASQARDNIALAEAQLKQSLSSVGTSIRSAAEHRQVNRAYYSTGYDEYTPIFLDEKK